MGPALGPLSLSQPGDVEWVLKWALLRHALRHTVSPGRPDALLLQPTELLHRLLSRAGGGCRIAGARALRGAA